MEVRASGAVLHIFVGWLQRVPGQSTSDVILLSFLLGQCSTMSWRGVDGNTEGDKSLRVQGVDPKP